MKKIMSFMLALALICFLAAGCTGMSSRQQRVLSGGAIGAGTGAAIGGISGGSVGTGAAVGGAAGAVGGLITDELKR